jgi:hypothetical protein
MYCALQTSVVWCNGGIFLFISHFLLGFTLWATKPTFSQSIMGCGRDTAHNPQWGGRYAVASGALHQLTPLT